MHKSLLSITKKYPVELLFSIFLLSLSALGMIFQYKLVAFIVNGIIFLGVQIKDHLNVIVLILLVIIFRTILNFSGELLVRDISSKIKKIVRINIIQHFLETKISNYHSGQFVSLILTKVEALEDYFSKFLPQIFLSIIIPVLIVAFVFPIDYLTALIFFITAPLIPFFMFLIGKYGEKATQKQLKSLSQLSVFFLDSIRGLKTILQYNQIDDHRKRIKFANQDFINKTMSVLRITFLSAFVLELISTISIAIVAVEIGLRLLYGYISFEQAFFVLLIAPDFYLPLRNLGLRFHAAMSGVEAYQEIVNLLHEDKGSSKTEGRLSLNERIQEIECRNISYKYPNSEKTLINNFSFKFKTGNHYALVGQNGSGKTTLFLLILRFLSPQNGLININGISNTNYDPDSLYRHIGWLPSSPAVFKGSVLENIKIANSQLTIEKANNLIGSLHIESFVDSLPNRLDTNIQEFGTTISSGQSQKIGLLRMFSRDASLLLCDEPTSSLDVESVNQLLDVFQELKKNKIIITITHDLRVIESADEILYLDPIGYVISGEFNDLKSSSTSFRSFIKHFSGGTSEC